MFKSYNQRIKSAEAYALKQKQKQKIYDIKHQYDKPKKGVAFGKLLLILMVIDVLIIQGFSMYMMWYLADSSSLPSLIGVIAPLLSLVAALVSYNKKSAIENSAGGIVYESAMSEINKIEKPEEGAVG